MVSTKQCCWGKCSSDSRFPEKLPKSLKEMAKTGKKYSYHSQNHRKALNVVNYGLIPALVNISPRKTLLESLIFVSYTGQMKWGRQRNFQILLRPIYR